MKVLIADDCSTTREILKVNLTKWGFEPMLVEDGEQALRILKSPAGPRLALLDWNMPKLDGVSVCREIRRRSENALNYRYIIVLTAKDGEENLVEALESGADDYVTKPVSPRELQLRTRAGERIIELQDRVVRTNRKLAVMTTHDQLTGLLNRQSVIERLTQELERSSRTGSHVSFVSIDVDRLKKVNDVFGFPVGDEMLRQIGERFRRAIRSYDILGRVGGEEFAVVLPETGLEMAVGMAERLRSCVASQSFLINGESINATISVGITSTSSDGIERKAIINGSELALREAKGLGDRVLMSKQGVISDPITEQHIDELTQLA